MWQGSSRRGEDCFLARGPVQFEDVVDAYVSTRYVSNEVTLAGLADSGFTTVSIEGGSLIINGETLAELQATVGNGDRLAVELMSSDGFSTRTDATVTVGDVVEVHSVLTGSEAEYDDRDGDGVVNVEDDDVPDPFSFTPVTDADRQAVYVSSPITVAGVATIGFTQVSVTDNTQALDVVVPRAFLRKNGEAVGSMTTMSNGDTLEIELQTPFAYALEVRASLTVGETTEVFSVTTRAYGAHLAEGAPGAPLWLGSDDVDYPGSVDQTASYYQVDELPDAWWMYLEDLTDDVDLYVYEDAAFTNLLCSSTASGTVQESCDLNGDGGSRYVVVDGSKSANGALFTLDTQP